VNFDPNNAVIKLCAEGMDLEGQGKRAEAAKLFEQAWHQAHTDLEKYVAAHYVARHQDGTAGKLKWDETALDFALKISCDGIKGSLPSLYLNIANDHEQLHDFKKANEIYHLALSFADFLLDDGYGNMIRGGIKNGIERVADLLELQ
jgi:hypothetical protein